MGMPAVQTRYAFSWRSMDGRTYVLEQMSTSHLFYAARAVWNYYAPDEHCFGETGTTVSFRQQPVAVEIFGSLLAEFLRRDDKPPVMRERVDWMIGLIRGGQVQQLPAPGLAR